MSRWTAAPASISSVWTRPIRWRYGARAASSTCPTTVPAWRCAPARPALPMPAGAHITKRPPICSCATVPPGRPAVHAPARLRTSSPSATASTPRTASASIAARSSMGSGQIPVPLRLDFLSKVGSSFDLCRNVTSPEHHLLGLRPPEPVGPGFDLLMCVAGVGTGPLGQQGTKVSQSERQVDRGGRRLGVGAEEARAFLFGHGGKLPVAGYAASCYESVPKRQPAHCSD